jgi:signal transduction histidine kinase
METGGQMSGGIALFRDISDEKEVERQRNEFISTASHEMRTPVAAVEGYLSLAMNPAVATIDERAKGYLDKAHSSTKHLGDLFRDLLAITKIEDNHEGGEEIFDLGAMAKDAVDDMRFEADKKHLEMQFAPSDQRLRGDNIVMPVYAVKANPQRVREVIMNLLENAIKFTPQGTVRLTIGGTNDAVTLSVIDSGIGISAEDIGHLFQKFYRVDNSSTRTIGGTGLGLYLCRSIIEKAGGKIWVDSKLGEGSAFRFNLPRLASDKIKKGAPKLQPGVATAALAFPTPVVPAAAAPATLSPASPVPSVPRPVPSAPSAAAGPTFTDIKKPVGVK